MLLTGMHERALQPGDSVGEVTGDAQAALSQAVTALQPAIPFNKDEHGHCGEQACPALGGEAAPNQATR